MERSNDSILREYNKNPFFQAKINYLLKQHSQNGQPQYKDDDEYRETLRGASSSAAKQMSVKLAQLS